MEDLRVPKRAVRVEVVLPGGEARQVSIYLPEGAATHPGPERLSDLLNGSAPSRERLVDFLNRPEPFLRLMERERVALIGRAHVARVALLQR